MMRRTRLAYLPFVLPLLALAEFLTFVSVAHAIGFVWALLALIGCTVAGLSLLRSEGIRAFRSFQEAATAGRPPAVEVTNSLIGLGGALLLAVPGFLTALVGVVLLLPPGRFLARRMVERFTERRLGGAAASDLFGPRKVRVHRGAPMDEPVVVVVPDDMPRTTAAAIEGEIVR
ncbi:FxsA family protein [Actinoplanes sp. NPDC051851]|uniref:FxsA family protein n=1 Tax=Actinoplanes sp. NPDC051851 TaxID=3154753 RepID=UPI0034168B89